MTKKQKNAAAAAAAAMAAARHASLTPEERSEIAAQGGKGRWAGMTAKQRKVAMAKVASHRKLLDALGLEVTTKKGKK